MPFDETGSCKQVSFDVVVTKDGEVPQGDALAMAKEDIAHGVQYLQGKSLEKYKDEWNIFSILRSGATIEQGKLDKYYESVVKQLNTSSKNMRVTDLARVALALEAMGKNPTDVGGFNVLEAIYNHKDMMTDSSNCPIFGLLALDGRNYEIPKDAKWSRKDLVKQILKFQKASGGFGLSLDNDTTGIDMTGMALQALAPYYDNSAYPEVKPAVDKALKHFKDNITINAGFLDMGSENSCTTAQVLTAVSALNIDPTVKENGFVQNGNNMISNLHTYKKDAGFAWQATMQGQEMATQQVTYALVAYQRMAEGQTRLYDFTDVPEEKPSVDPEDEKAAKAVEDQINAIGKVTLESKKAIEAARAAYEKLSEAQKKLVGNLETLTKAEAELKKLEEQQGQQGQEKPETSTVTLVNKKYGVSLQGEGLTEDMELQVEPLNKDSKDVERMRKEITSKKSVFRLFNIKLMKNGKEIQLPQKAVLSIPVGEKYNGKELVVLACSDKDIRQLKGKVANGSVSVEVTELMSFGVVVDTAASEKEVNSGSGTGTANSNTGGNSSGGKGVKTGDQTPMEVLVLLLTLSGAAVVMTAGKKRREQK